MKQILRSPHATGAYGNIKVYHCDAVTDITSAAFPDNKAMQISRNCVWSKLTFKLFCRVTLCMITMFLLLQTLSVRREKVISFI